MRPGLTWGTWAAGTALGFAALETWAMTHRAEGKPSTTLTATCRRACGVTPPHWRRHLCLAGTAAAATWFTGHIFFGWPP